MKSKNIRAIGSALGYFLLYALRLAVVIVSAHTICSAQQEKPPVRGFEPGGSYSLSNIESVNTTNGNVMLSFPFKLPPGRGGFAGQLGLHYDSKDIDSSVVDYSGPPNYNTIYRAMLGPSDQGGWHYGLGYGLQLYDRLWERSGARDCGDVYHWQVRVALPDGSVHEMIPRGWNSFNSGDGFYRIMPGYQAECRCTGTDPSDPNYCVSYDVISMPYSTGTITYYSFDGSYLKLDWQPDGNWTLYLGDGTRVTGCYCFNNSQQRIYDRNNNYVQIDNITYNDHPAVQLVDQLGRAIVLEGDYTNQRDLIHISGAGGAPLTYEIKWAAININKTYQPEYAAGGGAAGDTATLEQFYVVSEIDLPVESGGLKYLFSYNAPYSPGTPTPENGWGELSSITLPSGAQTQYQYALDGQSGLSTHEAMTNTISRKTLGYLQEYDGSSAPVSETTTFSISEIDGTGTATITNPDGGVTTESHSLNRTVSIRQPDGTVIERIWRQNTPQGHPGMLSYDYYGYNVYDSQRINNYVKTEFTSIKDANGNFTKTVIKDYNCDKNNNVTSVTEYDWVDYGSVPRDGNGNPTGIPGNAVVKRITTNTCSRYTPDASDSSSNYPDSYWNSSSPSLRSAFASTEISNGSQTLARTEFYYDDPGSTGNLTQQTSWDSTKGGYSNPLNGGNSISVSNQYDFWSSGTSGRLIQNTDARGTSTRFTYGSVNGFDLYPTQIQTAYQTSVQRTESRDYDFSTGLVARVTDVDNGVSTSTSYDVFGRPTLVKAADGKPEETRTSTEYSDTLRRVIVRSDLNNVGDGKLVGIQHYDQLGRVRLTRQLEDSANQSATDETTAIKVQTRYVYSGSNYYELASNPYRASSSGGAGGELTMGWIRSKHDQGGRVIEVQTFGGAGVPAPWGGNGTSTGTVNTSYNANEVTVTDQAGKARKSITDGLGRLSQVYEDPSGLNYLTSYNYDGLNNLVNVYQGIQTRTFVYDSLKRLTSATNPESSTINYDYDANGNLLHKIDPRLLADNQTHVTTTYNYDALNRVTSRSYNDGTPGVSYNYDSATNGKGRLASVSSNLSTYSYSAYDALGRVLSGSQILGSQSYSLGYTYDKASHVLTQTYPSGRAVTNTYDGAGRTNSVIGNLGDSTGRTYSTGISYASGGQMTQEQFGTATPVFNNLAYNARQQLTFIGATTVNDGATWNRGKIGNRYGLNCSAFDSGCAAADNNGNLIWQDIFIPGDDQVSSNTTWFQRYDYDSLNRLKSGGEASPHNVSWVHGYQYDQYGNRTIDTGSSSGEVPWMQFSVDPNTNRLGVPGGQSGTMSYDAAGNLTVDTYTGEGQRNYDAENRMTYAWANSQWQIYSYDGDGRRVKRNVNGAETWQVYGVGGELLAEYPASGDVSAPQKEYAYRNGQLLVTAEPSASVHWLVADQLGSPRMIFDGTGSLSGMTRHDYMNFGIEVGAGVSFRTTAMGYSMGEGVRQKFTQKERDNETGLDWFDSRYYASVQGRFTSTDHFEGNPAHLYTDLGSSPALPYSSLLNPQTLNAYVYVYNNPLSNVDPDGHQGGRKIPLPGKPRYQIRADIRNPNDAPNIHVFDKGGRREIGRVSIKPGGNQWEGKVPENVRAAVEKFISEKGIQPRLPGAQPRPRGASPGPEPEGLEGTTRVLRGTSNVLSALAFITGAFDVYMQGRQAERLGYYFNFTGEIVITDLAKAAQNFPAHYVLEVEGHYFVPKGNAFVSVDDCSCELQQDKSGKVHVVYKTE